jgi:hypothetical protein
VVRNPAINPDRINRVITISEMTNAVLAAANRLTIRLRRLYWMGITSDVFWFRARSLLAAIFSASVKALRAVSEY